MHLNKNTIYYSVLTFLIILSVGFGWLAFQAKAPQNTTKPSSIKLSEVVSNNIEPIVPKKDMANPKWTTSIAMSSDQNFFELSEFDIYSAELKKVVMDTNPKEALNKLASDTYTVKVVQKNCHTFTHQIGRFALEKYNNDTAKAISYNLDICGGGYIHGVIENYLDTVPNAEETITSLCTDPNDGGCFHALGHGAMLISKYNTDESVLLCKKLQNTKQEIWCGEGVFMENFDSENIIDSKKPFLNPENPFYPCSNYPSPYNDTCYYYSGRYIFKVTKDPYLSLQKCSQANSFAQTCIRGMSAGILRSDLLNPEKMEAYCKSVEAKYKNSCFQGSVNYYVLMFGKAEQTITEMCDKFQDESNKATCTNYANNSPFRT